MAGRAAEKEETTLAGRASSGLTPGDEAAAEALASLDFGEAPQVGLLGDTGCGKTVAAAALIELYLRKSPGWVLVVDDKETSPRYAGQCRRDVDELRSKPVDPNGRRVIVFRGVPSQGVQADPEEVAELAWKRAALGRKSLVVHDELVAGRSEFIKSRQWRKGITHIPKSFTLGRSPGISDLWGAQSPQEVPLDPFEQSHAILCFRLAGLGLETLRRRDYLQGGAELVIPKLPGPPLPPDQRGVFVLLRRGQPWNGKRYKFAVRP